MIPKLLIRLYVVLIAVVVGVIAAGLHSLGHDVVHLFPLALISLAVNLLVALLAYLLHRVRKRRLGDDDDAMETFQSFRMDWASYPQLTAMGIALAVAWLTATVLAVERAVHAGFNGWLALGLWILVSLLGIAVPSLLVGTRSARRREREVLAARAETEQAYEAYRLARQRRAGRAGMAYEPSSSELSGWFGRFEQQVPDDFAEAEERLMSIREVAQIAQGRLAPKQLQVLLTRAATLEATEVVRSQVLGVPVTVFDLELVDQDRLADPEHLGRIDLAERVDLTTRHLTCWMATLAYPLPFVSSLFAMQLQGDRWESELRSWSGSAEPRQRSVDLMTENQECARLLMSEPAVREAALSPYLPPFFVDGDRLIAAHWWQDAGAADLEQGMAWLSGLAQALPWRELDRYRAAAAAVDRSPRQRGFHLTYRKTGFHGMESTVDRVLERWRLGETRSGPRLFQRTEQLTWWNRQELPGQPAWEVGVTFSSRARPGVPR